MSTICLRSILIHLPINLPVDNYIFHLGFGYRISVDSFLRYTENGAISSRHLRRLLKAALGQYHVVTFVLL